MGIFRWEVRSFSGRGVGLSRRQTRQRDPSFGALSHRASQTAVVPISAQESRRFHLVLSDSHDMPTENLLCELRRGQSSIRRHRTLNANQSTRFAARLLRRPMFSSISRKKLITDEVGWVSNFNSRPLAMAIPTEGLRALGRTKRATQNRTRLIGLRPLSQSFRYVRRRRAPLRSGHFPTARCGHSYFPKLAAKLSGSTGMRRSPQSPGASSKCPAILASQKAQCPSRM